MATYNPSNWQVELSLPSTCPLNPLLDEIIDPTKTEAHASDVETIPSSLASSYKANELEMRQIKINLRKLLRTDQRSFLSGTPAMPMHACHIINAVRPKRRRQDREYRRIYIEKYLTELNFREESKGFGLDSRPNFLLLTAQEHYTLDLYGLIAFFPGEKRMKALLNQLKQDNEDWDKRVAAGEDMNRNLNYSLDVYNIDSYDWQVLVLYPTRFLPDGQTIKILDADKRSLRPGTTAVPASNTPDHWHDYEILGGGSAYLDPSSPLPPLPVLGRDNHPLLLKVNNCRKAEDKPSLFAMMVNLHSKLLAYSSAKVQHNVGLINLQNLSMDLMQQIFHQPPGKYTKFTPTGWIDFGEEVLIPEMDENADVIMASSPGNDVTTRTASGGADTESMAESEHDLNSEESESDDEDQSDADLTESEFNKLMARQTSSSLTDRQRSANFMKILFGPRGAPSFMSSQTVFE